MTILQNNKINCEVAGEKKRKIEKCEVDKFCSSHHFVQHSINCFFQTSHVYITKKQS